MRRARHEIINRGRRAATARLAAEAASEAEAKRQRLIEEDKAKKKAETLLTRYAIYVGRFLPDSVRGRRRSKSGSPLPTS